MMTLDDIQQIAVIGAGLMGHGIAQEFAFAGYHVHLHDVSHEKLRAGMERIRGISRCLWRTTSPVRIKSMKH